MSVHGKCYDVGRDSNELSSGTNEGVKTPRKKKGTENNENRFYIVCRRRAAQKIIPSTFSLVKQLP